jgi:ribosomal RNA assembly protein
MQYVKIPKERIAVLIGEKGSVKRDIEKRTNTKIEIEDASVSIGSTSEDSIGEWIAKDIVLAIGRGFSPEIARRLLSDEFTLAIIYLRDFAGTPKAMERMKGRVIGEGGRARRVIEDLTDTYVSVYGKTIAIIGSHDDVYLAKDAAVRLIEGARHASVWRFLEKTKSRRRFSPPDTGEI